MALADPVKVFVASSNIGAEMTCRALQAAGIEASAGEDTSPAGLWMGGTIPGIFDAGVFVSRVDAERATAVIRELDRLEAERAFAQGAEVEAVCEECGKTGRFPAVQRGTVQDCPHCGALIDVGEADMPGGWEGDSEDEVYGKPPSE
jgi:DNA-directed RNA polymerase subunit RPC12/RpoP